MGKGQQARGRAVSNDVATGGPAPGRSRRNGQSDGSFASSVYAPTLFSCGGTSAAPNAAWGRMVEDGEWTRLQTSLDNQRQREHDAYQCALGRLDEVYDEGMQALPGLAPAEIDPESRQASSQFATLFPDEQAGLGDRVAAEFDATKGLVADGMDAWQQCEGEALESALEPYVFAKSKARLFGGEVGGSKIRDGLTAFRNERLASRTEDKKQLLDLVNARCRVTHQEAILLQSELANRLIVGHEGEGGLQQHREAIDEAYCASRDTLTQTHADRLELVESVSINVHTLRELSAAGVVDAQEVDGEMRGVLTILAWQNSPYGKVVEEFESDTRARVDAFATTKAQALTATNKKIDARLAAQRDELTGDSDKGYVGAFLRELADDDHKAAYREKAQSISGRKGWGASLAGLVEGVVNVVTGAVGFLAKAGLIAAGIAAGLAVVAVAFLGATFAAAFAAVFATIFVAVIAVALLIHIVGCIKQRLQHSQNVLVAIFGGIFDGLGLTGLVYEGVLGRDRYTGDRLDARERWRRGTEGLLTAALLALGARGAKSRGQGSSKTGRAAEAKPADAAPAETNVTAEPVAAPAVARSPLREALDNTAEFKKGGKKAAAVDAARAAEAAAYDLATVRARKNPAISEVQSALTNFKLHADAFWTAYHAVKPHKRGPIEPIAEQMRAASKDRAWAEIYVKDAKDLSSRTSRTKLQRWGLVATLAGIVLTPAGVFLATLFGRRETDDNPAPDDDFPYDLDKPENRKEDQRLPPELDEISGLTVDKGRGDGSLFAVQDEKGVLYRLEGNQVVERTTFKDKGDEFDFEGVEWVPPQEGERDGTVYAVTSNGTVYADVESGAPEKHNSPLLSSLDDIEGLGYDGRENRLLLASKSTGNVYEFDIATSQFSEHALYRVPPKPSGIAIHPHSGHTYVLSAVNRELHVIDAAGVRLKTIALGAEHTQAEGIAFDSQGNLYISNEKGDFGASATIRKYAPHH